ncbi:MAG: IPT/TIG domain-containing protein [Myxococcota bacterium]
MQLKAVPVALLALTLFAGCGEGGGDMQILSIDPPNGATQGEQPVKIGGRNFRTDIGYTVFFGTNRSSQVTIIDPETLLVVTPPQNEAGNVDITIRADNGDAFRIHDGFEYQQVGGGIITRIGEGPEKNDMGALAY